MFLFYFWVVLFYRLGPSTPTYGPIMRPEREGLIGRKATFVVLSTMYIIIQGLIRVADVAVR